MLLNQLRKSFLAAGDALVLYLSLWLTLLLRFGKFPAWPVWHEHFAPFTVLFALWLLVFFINGLYETSASKNDVEFYNKLLRNILIAFALSAAYFYLLAGIFFHIKPLTVFFIFMIVAASLLTLWRFWYNGLVQRPTFLKNVVVIGMNDEARELVEEIIQKPQLGYRIVAIMHDSWRAGRNHDFPGVQILGSNQNLKKLIQGEEVTTIVTALDPHQSPELVAQVYECLALGVQFFDLPKFYETLTGKIPVTSIGHIWFLENVARGREGLYEAGKRALDILFALAILAISIPFWPLIALAIRADSKGPIFFRQMRIGHLGRPFEAVKFRSMIEAAEADGFARWASVRDPRVTRVGRLLRRARLDEIPQLWNLLKGEMSIVGPRPERPEFIKNLQRDIPFYSERHLVKPGLTGWAQINFQYGASTKDAFKKLQYDLFYVKNRSIPLDVGIILKTINIMLTGKGHR